jgi:hypothetical protein
MEAYGGCLGTAPTILNLSTTGKSAPASSHDSVLPSERQTPRPRRARNAHDRITGNRFNVSIDRRKWTDEIQRTLTLDWNDIIKTTQDRRQWRAFVYKAVENMKQHNVGA